MQFLKMLFTWWHGATLGTALFTSRRGRLIGMDDQGNKYYVDKKNQSLNGKVRRWVIYEGDVEASRVPPEWHAWLHYTVDTPPSEVMPERNNWEKPHQVNMTGTSHAHKPKGSLLDDVPEAAEGVGYQAWKPE
jgi:NADH:ubiquinone oxidoreductase subunit